jgi:hypothetical protein
VLSDPTTKRPRFTITRYEAGTIKPIELNGSGAMLLVQQSVEVEEDHVATQTYQYRVQGNEDRNSWVFRWEYFRKKPRKNYPYPLAHFHVNAASANYPDVPRMHFATRRVPLELVLWTLLAEGLVQPLDDKWETTLDESIAGFDERRTVS